MQLKDPAVASAKFALGVFSFEINLHEKLPFKQFFRCSTQTKTTTRRAPILVPVGAHTESASGPREHITTTTYIL